MKIVSMNEEFLKSNKMVPIEYFFELKAILF